jgi:hypothetical protein
LSDLKVGKHESPTRIGESFAQAGDGEGLAGGSSNEKVNCVCDVPFMMLGHIAQIRCIRPVVGEHGGRKGFDLGEG